MSKKFMGKKAKAAVAVSFDQRTSKVLPFVQFYGERTGATLDLLHVVEPFHGGVLGRATAKISEVTAAIDQASELKAESQLEEVKRSLGLDAVDSYIGCGPVVPGLVSLSMARGAALLFCGAAPGDHRGVYKGFSTALGLMASSPLPTIVVAEDTQPPSGDEPMTILVADDLSEQGEEPLLFALDMARALGNAKVIHLHVNAFIPDRVEQLVKDHPDTFGELPGKDVATWMKTINDKCLAKMRQRFPEHIPLIEARGGSYEARVEVGEVSEVVAAMADMHDAKLLVFGRHHAVHRKPFAFGKMPVYEMLAQKRAVAMVPPRS